MNAGFLDSPSSDSRFCMIASDLDGTLLRSDKTVSERTRVALRRAQGAGIAVVLSTARPPFTARTIAVQAGVRGLAVCSNGAILYDLATDEVLHQRFLDSATALRLMSSLRSAVPELCFAAVQGVDFSCEREYSVLARYEDHARAIEEMAICAAEDFVNKPITKLLIRHPIRRPDELVEHVRSVGFDGFESAHSGAPFLEVTAAGVTKASGLALLCARLGIDSEQVIAFGDAPNDAAMLRWAGWGVAVANAFPEALAAADEIAPSNDDDGVATVIERVLDGRT